MEARVEATKRLVSDINDMLLDSPEQWHSYRSVSRSVMNTLDQIRFFRIAQRLPEQIWFLRTLQDFAFHDADNGYLGDVAEWCQSKWLRVLRDHPENSEVLSGKSVLGILICGHFERTDDQSYLEIRLHANDSQGLGRNWLQKAQKHLATIQQSESTGSSSGHSSGNGTGGRPLSASNEQLQSSAYVEARGCLRPAVDFFSSAVASARGNGGMTGDLLESIISNVHNLTASLFGIGAGILGLESYPGFLFYLFFSLLTSTLLYVLRVLPYRGTLKEGDRATDPFFGSALGFWTAGLVDGLSGFVLTWTLFYGLVRA
ncbi:MAG: hypothetical protein M1818_001494 [Claussenomyces sp. TS43310]|nr:MAG: hypothetical protein M1818_001494 [Claussenomyces sp. TS43310]